jgi:hypothetical protein
MARKGALRALLLGAFLQFGAMAGVAMRPEDIENIMRTMHQTKIEYVIPAEPKRRPQRTKKG